MLKRQLSAFFIAVAVVAMGLLAGCHKAAGPPAPSPPPSASVPTINATPPEQPVAPEKNPPGDIPDSQVFITYTSPTGRYAVEAPEGWARVEHGTDVEFTDKFDGQQVALSERATPPTVSSVQRDQAQALQQHGRAVKIQGVKTRSMPQGNAVVYLVYTSNSAPDPVTGKQIRLDNITYYFHHQGTLAALTLWAPRGADNADQWKRISESFRWL
jgi:hypothetical protein